jgi:hypothetical protein
VPPLFTRLKMSTTTSSDLSAPVTSDVQVDIQDAEQPAHPAHVVPNLGGKGSVLAQVPDELAQSGGAFLHQGGEVDPERIVLHLQWLVVAEGFRLEVEAQPGERLRVAVEELRRLATHDAIE